MNSVRSFFLKVQKVLRGRCTHIFSLYCFIQADWRSVQGVSLPSGSITLATLHRTGGFCMMDGLMYSLHVLYILISVSGVIFNLINTEESLHLKFSTLPSDDSCSNRAGVVLNSHTPPPEQVFMSTCCYLWALLIFFNLFWINPFFCKYFLIKCHTSGV